jgi:glutamyl/glutaminyl-tRNA synthetase
MPDPITHYTKTRIAPTPSGFLHLGNILSFAITAALAKKHGAKILLRIDDIDQARANKQYIQDIFDTLNFLEIPWDEGPRDIKEVEDSYSQLHWMNLYSGPLSQLKGKGLIYACNCSRKQLNSSTCSCFKLNIPLTTENVSWRLLTDIDTELTVKNYNGETITTSLPASMHDFIVRKKDGFPAYQLTSVIDDLRYNVDLVVRGEDLWQSTLAQHQLALALGAGGFKNITFYHHPLITGADGKKLSKSAGATSVKYLRENGKSATDIYTMIGAILGSAERIENWQQLAAITINDYKRN